MHFTRLLTGLIAGLLWMSPGVRADDPPRKPFQFGSSDFRHPGTIIDAILSPDAKSLATVCYKDVRVWDIETGRCLHHFPDCGVPPYSTSVNVGRLAFSSDGKQLCHAVNTDVAARVWDLSSGREIRTFGTNPPAKDAHISPRTWVQFAPGEKAVKVLRQDGIESFDPDTGKAHRKSPFTVEIFDLLAIAPDGKIVAGNGRSRKGLGPDPGKVIIVDSATGKELIRLPVAAHHAGFSLDGSLLATLDGERLQIWDAKTGKEIGSMPRPPVEAVDLRTDPAFSPDNKVIYVGGLDGSIRRLDWRAGKELPPFGKHLWCTTKVLPLPDAKLVLSVGHDGAIRRWDATTGKEIPLPIGYTGTVSRSMSLKTGQVALGDWGGRIDIWNATGSTMLRTLRTTGSHVGALAFSPVDGTLASFHWDGHVRVWDIESGKELRSFRVCPAFEDNPRRFLFGPDEKLYVNTEYGKVQAWDAKTGKPLWPQALEMSNFAISPDGRLVVFAQFQSTNLHVLDPAVPNRIEVMSPSGSPPRDYQCYALAFVSDRRVASGHSDGSVRLWNVKQRTETKALRRDGTPIYALYASSNGDWLITRSRSELVVWDCYTEAAVDSMPHADVSSRLKANRADLSGWPEWPNLLPADWLNRIRPPRDSNWPSGDAAWKAIAGKDGPAAYRALCGLVTDPVEAVRVFRAQLRPAAGESPERIAKLIGQLNADRFAEREMAAKSLAALGEVARPALMEALNKGPSVDSRERLQRLLDALVLDRTPDEVRIGRAIQALETAGTAEARKLLLEWARGARGPFQTEASLLAIERLDRSSIRNK